ncbi:MAG: hypothetical protein Q7J21_03550 [Rugosibacter sp.]|nr:hypothetical protein [Rugosibacter sp.]
MVSIKSQKSSQYVNALIKRSEQIKATGRKQGCYEFIIAIIVNTPLLLAARANVAVLPAPTFYQINTPHHDEPSSPHNTCD